MKKFTLAVIACLLPSSMVFSQEERPLRFDRISVESGLSQSVVQCILQDRRGFMWFGTMDGLNLFDGYRFTVFKHDPTDPDSLINNQIHSLLEDRSGRLWVGTAGGLDLFDRASNRFRHYRHDPEDPESLSHNAVTCILEDRADVVWVGTRGGLNRFIPPRNESRPGTFRRYPADPSDPAALSHDGIGCLLEDVDGTLWIGTLGGGLNGLDRRREMFARYGPRQGLWGDRVFSLYEDRWGMLWVGTDVCLNRSRPGQAMTFVHPLGGPASAEGGSAVTVFAIKEEPSGALWVGSYGSGLWKVIPEMDPAAPPRCLPFRHNPDDPTSLSHDSILALLADKSGVLWIGTSGGGLSKLNLTRQLFSHYRSESGDPLRGDHNFVFSIYEDRTEIIWLGTRKGLCLLNRATGQTFRPWLPSQMPDFLRDSFVRGIAEDASGALWFGVHGRGIVRYDPAKGEFDSFSRESSGRNRLSSDLVMAVYRDSKGRIWAATTGEGLNRFDPASGGFVAYRHSPGDPESLSSDDVRVVYEDRSGALWIGTYDGGLCRLTWKDVEETLPVFDSFRNESGNPSSLSSDSVLSVCEDREGILWIGTLDGGLNRFDREKGIFTCYLEKDGLANNAVYGILEDGSGDLWLSTNNGLSEFHPGTGTFRNFNVKDGLQSPEFNGGSSFRSPAGELFFGGINGLNAFEPEKMRKSLFIPPIVITEMRPIRRNKASAGEFGLPRYPNTVERIEVSYKDAVLEFGFAALDYSNPEKNRFAYKIEGRDRDWIPLEGKTRITTSSLPPGDYLFRVKGSNSDGIWNQEGATVVIKVVPPFWGTRTFVLISGLLVLAAFVGAYRLRKRVKAPPFGDEADMEPVFLKYGISRREQEIVRLILQGKSNREIEKDLFISLSTVKNHVYNIYQKLGVKNRYELIVLFRTGPRATP